MVGGDSGELIYKVPQSVEPMNQILILQPVASRIRSTAWRKTGSTFVYTLLVRYDEACSNNL